MRRSTSVDLRAVLVLAVLPLLAGHCGGSVASMAGANSDADVTGGLDGGLCEGKPASGEARAVPVEHRSQSLICDPSSLSLASAPPPDAGEASCSSDADCQPDGSFPSMGCLAHRCTVDQCLTDADCGAGNACICALGGGLRISRNTCVPADCHLDSDCGAGEYCTESLGYCGTITGLYCTTTTDTCVDVTTDCACGNQNGGAGANACVYAPQVGHWVCGENVCDG